MGAACRPRSPSRDPPGKIGATLGRVIATPSVSRVLVLSLALAVAPRAVAQSPAPRPPGAPPTATAPQPTPAPPLAAPRAPAAAPAPPAPGRAPTPAPALDPATAANGVVILERAGKFLALGVILNGDGRILAPLFALSGAQNVDARYADGTRVPARLGHADRARDLALLVPQNGRHRLGLRASRKTPQVVPKTLKSFTAAGQRVLAGANLLTTGPSSLSSADGKPLPDAITFSVPVPTTSAGSPLLDESGEVVAVLTRACKRAPGTGCTAELAGMPVSAVREFLQKVPASAVIPVAWLGIEAHADDSGSSRGVRVGSVRGPALSAGLRAGQDVRSADLIVAIDGVPVVTPEALHRSVEDRAIGDTVDLLVLGGGRFRHVTLVLAAAAGRENAGPAR
jgi:S1-C subfamily serine protease